MVSFFRTLRKPSSPSLRPTDGFPVRFGTQQYRTDLPQKWDELRNESPSREHEDYRPEVSLIVQQLKPKNTRRVYFEATRKKSNFIKVRKNNIFYKYGKWEFVHPLKLVEGIIKLNQTHGHHYG